MKSNCGWLANSNEFFECTWCDRCAHFTKQVQMQLVTICSASILLAVAMAAEPFVSSVYKLIIIIRNRTTFIPLFRLLDTHASAAHSIQLTKFRICTVYTTGTCQITNSFVSFPLYLSPSSVWCRFLLFFVRYLRLLCAFLHFPCAPLLRRVYLLLSR